MGLRRQSLPLMVTRKGRTLGHGYTNLVSLVASTVVITNKIGVSLPGRQLHRNEQARVPLRGTMAKLLPVLSSICMSVHFPVGSVAQSIKQSPPCLYESPGPARQNQTRPRMSKSVHNPSLARRIYSPGMLGSGSATTNRACKATAAKRNLANIVV